MIVTLSQLEFKIGDTLSASITGVTDWAAVLLKDARFFGHAVHGQPVLLIQSGLGKNTPTYLEAKLKWGGWLAAIVVPGVYLLKVIGHDSGGQSFEVDNLIRIT
jgi:hypothetical protein